MHFTQAELSLIRAAKHKVKMAQRVRVAVIVLIILGIIADLFGLMATGLWLNEWKIFIAAGLVLLAVALPQFGHGPKYEELLSLLEHKSAQRP